MHRKVKIYQPDPSPTTNINEDRLTFVNRSEGGGFKVSGYLLPIQIRDEGEFSGKAFYLDERFDWELGTDLTGKLILIPLKPVRTEKS